MRGSGVLPSSVLLVSPGMAQVVAAGVELVFDECRRLGVPAPDGAAELLAHAREVASGPVVSGEVSLEVSDGPDTSGWITTTQAAARLGRHETLVRRWARRGRLRSIGSDGEPYLFDPDSVAEMAAWLNRHGRKQP